MTDAVTGDATRPQPAPVDLTGIDPKHAEKETPEHLLSTTVAETALGVTGVHHLGGTVARSLDRARRQILGTSSAPGVTVATEDGATVIDLDIVVDYPLAIDDVVAATRTQVTRAARQLVDGPVAVNVTVTDVHGPYDQDPALLGAIDQAGEKARDLKDRATDTASDLGDRATDAAGDLRDRAADLGDRATDAAGDLRDRAADLGDRATDAAGDLRDRAADLGDKATDAAGDLRDRAADLAARATDAAGDLGDRAADVGDRAADAAGDLRDRAADVAETTADAADDLEARASDVAAQAQDTADELRQQADEKPTELR
jgi:uncharacterized alkaline shock family protein YloU